MLIECPECDREVSSGAEACPECAYPLAERGSSRFPPVVQTKGESGLELTKQILGRVIFGGILLASGAAYDAPPVVLSAIFVWATALPIWIKAKRAEGLQPGGEVSRVEKQLERRVSELEDRHLQQMADMEDQHTRNMAEFEERLDFAERLLTKERAGGRSIPLSRS